MTVFWIWTSFILISLGALLAAWRAEWQKHKGTLKQLSALAESLNLKFYPAFDSHTLSANIGEKIGLDRPPEKVLGILNIVTELAFFWPNNSCIEHIFCRIFDQKYELVCKHIKKLGGGVLKGGTKWEEETLLILETNHHFENLVELKISNEEVLKNFDNIPPLIRKQLAGFTLFAKGKIILLMSPDKKIELPEALKYLDVIRQLPKQQLIREV